MRKIKLYSNNYEGAFYDTFEGDLNDVRHAEDADLKTNQVATEDLIVGGVYLIENGSTVEYIGNKTYSIIDRTPLFSDDSINNLNSVQRRLFWILVKNCKNGTYFGI